MVRIAQPYGLVYLPSYVAVDQHLIEQHAKAAGLGDVSVSLTHMASGPAANDMLLSGNADLAMGGFGPAFTIWDKTHGAQQVRGVMPLSSSPVFLISVDPRIQSLKDFRDGDKISVSAIKVTDQAITLEMAAAKEWGWDQRFRLDPLTVSMSNPDALIAMLERAERGEDPRRDHPVQRRGIGIRQGASGDDVGSVSGAGVEFHSDVGKRAVPRSEPEAVRRRWWRRSRMPSR